MTEEEIIDLIRRQDDAGMSALAERFEKLLFYIVRGILGSRQDDIEECVNDTYLKIWRNVEWYDFERASLATWLKVIARNTALNRLRDVRRHEEQCCSGELSELADTVADARQNVENQIVRKEQAARLNEVVRRLPDRERELMLRKYFYLQSSKTIASSMGMTVNAVDTRLSRLRSRMREEFSEWEQEGGTAENDRGNAC